MNGIAEFHYRLPTRASGARPGSHPGASFGAGQQFAMHGRLFDYPDPRRLDLRASVRAARSEWLVRVNLQRVAVPVVVIVDVSASMQFGTRLSKLEIAADFVEALGFSAFRVGDRLGMQAFDSAPRDDLFMPERYGRGTGNLLATMLRACAAREAGRSGADGLRRCATRLAGRQALVFVVSDFHWPLASMPAVLDLLIHACVVPVVVWDEAEISPPARGPLLAVNDAESGEERSVWLRASVRERWQRGVIERRATLGRLFGSRGMPPFYIEGSFDPEAMSRYFLEAAT